jgi:hypothetical protein
MSYFVQATKYEMSLYASLCSQGGRTASLCSRDSLTTWVCDLTISCDQRWEPEGTRGAGSSAGIGATSRESSYRKMSKSLVRWGDTEKGKSTS